MKNRSIFSVFLLLTFFCANSSPLPDADLGKNRVKGNALPNDLNTTIETLRMNMFVFDPNGTPFLVDGTLTRYSHDYRGSVDGLDARKMTNPGENIGMLRDNITLVIESRQTITLADTIFFKMWGMQKKSYQMQFIATNLNHPGFQCVLEDNYLHSSTTIGLSDTTKITFAINGDMASSAQDRFRVVFKKLPEVLPFIFTNVNAYTLSKNIIVEWQTLNEINVKNYAVEKSVGGKTDINEIPVIPNNVLSGNYQWVDDNPVLGDNYYRIRSLDMNGKIEYSAVMKVYVTEVNQGIKVYPNPATINNLNLQLYNQNAGIYKIQLINSNGQILAANTFNYPGGTGNQKLKLGKFIPKGIYQLEIIIPKGEKKIIRVVF